VIVGGRIRESVVKRLQFALEKDDCFSGAAACSDEFSGVRNF
jgi:hypothetical protein